MRVFPYNKYESKMDGHWAHLLVPLCSRFLVAAVLLLFVFVVTCCFEGAKDPCKQLQC